MRLPLLLPIFLCALATVALGKSVLGETENGSGLDIGLPVENKHDSFFKTLSQSEKEWLMKVAILYAETPVIEIPEIPEIEEPSPIGRAFGGFVPFPVEDETPIELMNEMLNGKIPEGWQKEFTSWLGRNYNLTTYNFNYYKSFGTFCPPHHSHCPGFGDIGAECCPFG